MKPGTRLRSVVCTTEVIVLKAPRMDVQLECGGKPMGEFGGDMPDTASIDPRYSTGTELGKRYTHPASLLEVLCTKGGKGTLAVDGEALVTQGAKQLPSSD